MIDPTHQAITARAANKITPEINAGWCNIARNPLLMLPVYRPVFPTLLGPLAAANVTRASLNKTKRRCWLAPTHEYDGGDKCVFHEPSHVDAQLIRAFLPIIKEPAP